MNTRIYGRALAFMAWRVFQATVIFPAAIVGTFLAILTAAGQHPVEATLEGIYHFGETAVRPAPPGHVLVTECRRQPTSEAMTKPPVLCDATQPKEVPMQDAIASAIGTLRNLYFALLALSFGALVMAFPDRRFLGLPEVQLQQAKV